MQIQSFDTVHPSRATLAPPRGRRLAALVVTAAVLAAPLAMSSACPINALHHASPINAL